MGAHKDEYPPLLPAGLHRMTAQDLKALAADKFQHSTRRAGLWANFQKLLNKLAGLKLPCEIWVDGSFLTEKPDPSDVDFVVDVPIAAIAGADAAQAEILEKLAKKKFKKTDQLHSFVMFTAPVGHLAHADSLRAHDQWRKDFGFSYVNKAPKGIALIEVLP